jgi:osmotically-inducible protein OsmY
MAMPSTKVARTVKTDAQIRREVLDELAWDTRVEATDVGVAAEHGVVTLSGTVGSYAKKLLAQGAAHRVTGVRDVANDIIVRSPAAGTGRTDTEIALAIRHALEWDDFVPADRIRSTVVNGIVTLEGTVDVWQERDEAARAVRRLVGVRDVINAIKVVPDRIEAEIVRGAIEEALARRAEREAERITVAVRDGAVTVSGAVRTWAEKRAVIGAAAHAPGVHYLEDDLRIEPYA